MTLLDIQINRATIRNPHHSIDQIWKERSNSDHFSNNSGQQMIRFHFDTRQIRIEYKCNLDILRVERPESVVST